MYYTVSDNNNSKSSYFEGLFVNAPGADVVVAGVDQGHGLWQRRQLRDVIFPDHQLSQLGQTHEGFVVDGRDLVGGQVDPLQLVWRGARKHARETVFSDSSLPKSTRGEGHLHSDRKHTHEGEVGLVDLGDSVVAGVEVSGVFGERWHSIQLQVVTVDRTTEARAQQASGHTCSAWTNRGRKAREGGSKM